MNYYNEWDKHAAAWLRELIKAGLIPKGDVDERSIKEVQPKDLDGYTQCHFFAGIGGWSLALRLAGWSEDREVWTGSCPCQPFSVGAATTGNQQGLADERNLWPLWRRLIAECKPAAIFGEQVERAAALGWLDAVIGDLEFEGYSIGTVVLRAKDFGARHERKRLYFVADAGREGWKGHQPKQGVPFATSSPLSVSCDVLARAGRAVDGDLRDILPADGLSVVMERHALKGYGNAIVPQVAAEFIKAYLEVIS